MASDGTAAYKAPEKPAYKIILIENLADKSQSEWKKGSKKGLLIVSDADFDKFRDVLMDGASVAKDNYTAAAGSTEITLKPEYLETLKEGTHRVTIVSSDGEASADIKVAAADKNDDSTTPSTTGKGDKKSPKTGKPVWPAFAVILVLTAAASAGAVWTSRRKHE